MLSYLADFENHFGPLRLFGSHIFRTVMATITAIFIGFMIGPRLIAKLRRLKFGLDPLISKKREPVVAAFTRIHSGFFNRSAGCSTWMGMVLTLNLFFCF